MAAYLIGIENAEQVATHPLRGALFENAVVGEVLKHRFNRGNQPNLSFFRDSKGLECDLFYPAGHGIAAFEVKSGATISSEHFRSLHRVAELVPAITSKTVVYGGTTRQSRSDSEAITLADLAGTLKMLEVNREIATFVEEHKGPAPDDADVSALDAAYAKDIRPTLDGLGLTLGPLADSLFRTSNQISYVDFDNRETNSSSLLEARRWEQTKAQYIVSDGFKLSDSRPLKLRHIYTFRDYIGRGNAGFNVQLAILWHLDGAQVSRLVTIDGAPIPECGASIPYEEFNDSKVGIDQTIAEIGGRLMRRIGEMSAAPFRDDP